LTVMTAFAVSPEPRSRVRRTFSPGQSDDTRQSASRACGSVASATRAGDDGVAARPARGDERGLGRHGTRGSGVGGDGDRRVARPPSSRQRIIPLGRTRADSRPRPSRADTPPPRERPQVIRDPFEKPLPTRDELPYWSMREVLPELLETEETAVRPRAIVRPAPRTARSGHSRPCRDRARLGSATRDENLASGVFPEPRARRNARRPRDEAMKRPRTS
jgi:hypothetical protein